MSTNVALTRGNSTTNVRYSSPLPQLNLRQLLGEVPITHIFEIEKAIPGSNERADPVHEANLVAMGGARRRPICSNWRNGTCRKGTSCNLLHSMNSKSSTVVCKHWLRGLCKKAARCDFLHEYDLDKMPICQFWRDAGECNNPECLYRHVRQVESMHECPWYKRGFCRHGPKCRHKHLKRKACANYLMGFCIDGPNCKFGHPSCLHRPDMPRVQEEVSFPHHQLQRNSAGQLQGIPPPPTASAPPLEPPVPPPGEPPMPPPGEPPMPPPGEPPVPLA